jgi:hypothetical protein
VKNVPGLAHKFFPDTIFMLVPHLSEDAEDLEGCKDGRWDHRAKGPWIPELLLEGDQSRKMPGQGDLCYICMRNSYF